MNTSKHFLLKIYVSMIFILEFKKCSYKDSCSTSYFVYSKQLRHRHSLVLIMTDIINHAMLMNFIANYFNEMIDYNNSRCTFIFILLTDMLSGEGVGGDSTVRVENSLGSIRGFNKISFYTEPPPIFHAVFPGP